MNKLVNQQPVKDVRTKVPVPPGPSILQKLRQRNKPNNNNYNNP